jgi:hypothetical protein
MVRNEMVDIEPGENPTRTLTWKSVVFLSHIKSRTNDDRFPLPLDGSDSEARTSHRI